MLPRNTRLAKKSEINQVLKNGESIASHCFSLKYLKTKGKEKRFAFVVSSKVSKNATIRNKAKRALREGVRQSLFSMNEGVDCVFLAKPIIAKTYTNEIMKEVKAALSKAGLTK